MANRQIHIYGKLLGIHDAKVDTAEIEGLRQSATRITGKARASCTRGVDTCVWESTNVERNAARSTLEA